MAASAQFHTVTPHTARYRIERVAQGTAGKTTEVTEKGGTGSFIGRYRFNAETVDRQLP